MLMYVTITPKVVMETLKRQLGCGFVNETTDRVRDSNSYSLREYHRTAS